MLRPLRLTLAACLIASMLGAGSAAAQDVAVAQHRSTQTPERSALDQPAGLDIESLRLAEAFAALQEASGVRIAFSPSLLPDVIVGCDCAEMTVRGALDRLLTGIPFRYALVGAQVLIEPDPAAAHGRSGAIVAAAAVAVSNGRAAGPAAAQLAQTGTVEGTVVVAGTLRPLPGSQVVVQGTSIGGLADSSGRYRLTDVPAGEITVRVQMIGYATAQETVTLGAGETVHVDFQLREQALDLDAIVVTGTAGQTRRREMGSSISEFRADQVIQPVQNVDNLLQARVPGMTVMRSSGAIGSGAQIRLRGNVSVAMSNQPLIYVDGVRVRSDGYPRNASPTERQDRGPNDTSSPINDLNPHDIERIEVVKGAAATTLYGTEAAAGVIQIFTKQGVSGSPVWTASITQGLDWQRPFAPAGIVTDEGASSEYLFIDPWLRTGHRQSYQLSVRGAAAERINYFLSFGLEDNEGTYPLDEETRASVRGNVGIQAHDQLRFQWNTAYSRAHLQHTPAGNNSNGLTLNAFRRDNNFVGDGSLETVTRFLDYEIDSWIDRFTTGVTVTYTPIDHFTHRYTIGYDLAMAEHRNLRPYGFIVAPNGILSNRRWSYSTLSHDYVGNFEWARSGSLRSTISWGAQLIEEQEVDVGGHVEDLPGPGVPTLRSGARQSAGEDRMRIITGGFFLQNSFGLHDRYFVTVGARVDGNSAFGDALGLQTYPKISGSYVISEEPFWPAGGGDLRLRAAYGHAGRAPGAFDAARTWDPIGWRGQPAFQPQNLGNPDLGPERTAEIEFGFEGALFDQRMAYQFTYYNQRTRNALFNVRQIPSMGFLGSQLENVGELENKGIELGLSGVLVQRPNFGVETGMSLSTNHGRVLSLGGAPPFGTGSFGWIEKGLPIPAIRADRIMNPDEKAEPIIDEDHVWGPNQPTLIIQPFLSLHLPWQVQLDVRGEYQGGHYMYDAPSLNALRRAVEWPTCFNAYGLLEQGRYDDLTAWERSACIAANVRSDWFIVPADFFKLREIGVRVPVDFAVPGASSAVLTVAGRDLFGWRAMDVLDPEMQSGEGMFSFTRSLTEHIPPPASFVASLQVTF